MSRSAEDIQDWLIARISAVTGIAPHEIDARQPLLRYGLDSAAVVALMVDLEGWLGYRFRANPLEEHPTIVALSQFLASQVLSPADPEV
jgi:acyl carrier protein